MKIGIIGFGHLGKSLTKGLLNDGFVPQENIYVSAKSEETKTKAVEEYGVNVCASNTDLIYNSDVIFVSVPSKVFFDELSDIDITDCKNKYFISLMAGVTSDKLRTVLGDANIIRAMPNLGIERNDGVICYTKTDNGKIIEIFNRLGYSFTVEESDIEKVTAFASCGIGFAAYTLNCFLEAGKMSGFSDEVSRKIVDNIFSNALKAENYSKLATAVATKGGATEAGLKSLDENDMKEIIRDAINKAYCKMM